MAQRLLTQAELAEVLPLTTRQIRRLTTEHVLVTKVRKSRTVYPLAENVRRFVAYREELARASQTEVGESKARKLAAEAAMAELELAEKEGNLVPLAMHESRLAAVLDRLRAKLLAAPGSWAPRLLGAKSVPDMIQRLKPLVATLLENLSKEGDRNEEDAAA